jgi:hypothetical protein
MPQRHKPLLRSSNFDWPEQHMVAVMKDGVEQKRPVDYYEMSDIPKAVPVMYDGERLMEIVGRLPIIVEVPLSKPEHYLNLDSRL